MTDRIRTELKHEGKKQQRRSRHEKLVSTKRINKLETSDKKIKTNKKIIYSRKNNGHFRLNQKV